MEPKELSAEEIVELKNGELEAASGGTGKPLAENPSFTCPQCGSDNITSYSFSKFTECICNFCGYQWIVY